MISNRPDDAYEEAIRRIDEWPLLVRAIVEADECSKSYEGVGLLYWMEGCQQEDTEEYKKIKEILSANTPDQAQR